MGEAPEEPCCDYRDHESGECLCPEHPWSRLHWLGQRCPDCPPHTGGMVDVWCVCSTCKGSGAASAA